MFDKKKGTLQYFRKEEECFVYDDCYEAIYKVHFKQKMNTGHTQQL